MNAQIEALSAAGGGYFPCPSCGATASDNNAYPYCPNGCTETRMLAAIEVVPPTCKEEHDPYKNPADKCPACYFEKLHAKDEGERWLHNHRLDLLRRAAAGGNIEDALLRFPLASAKEVAARELLPDSLPNILGPRGTVTEITAYRGTGKSILTHDMAQAIAHGSEEFLNRPLRLHGPVLYIAREGVPGWTKRVLAWESYYGMEAGDGVTFMHDPIDITKPADLAALSAVLGHLGAAMLVLDPASMTGGHTEDEKNYQEYRSASLALAREQNLVVVILTNTGHAIRTRGRNSSMLVDGMDVSISLLKDDKTGVVKVDSNKTRDMAKIKNLQLKFVPAGDTDPETGEHYSGLWVPLTEEDKEDLVAEEMAKQMVALNRALRTAEDALRGRCSCPQGASASPDGCELGGAKMEVMVEVLGLNSKSRERSKRVKDHLAPAVEQGRVRTLGKTQGLRWHWGKQT